MKFTIKVELFNKCDIEKQASREASVCSGSCALVAPVLAPSQGCFDASGRVFLLKLIRNFTSKFKFAWFLDECFPLKGPKDPL